MKKFAIIALVVLAVAVIGLLVAISMQPDEMNVERTTTIAAAPEEVFQKVNDLHQWEQWSPWAKLDPEMKVTYSGSDSGEGAKYHWIGNSDVGEGRMTITDSQENERVEILLEFIKPFASTNTTVFRFEPAGDQTDGDQTDGEQTDGEQTKVVWSMTGENNFMSKAMGLFVDIESMVGADFEKGLSQLKSVSEEQPGDQSETSDAEAGDAASEADDDPAN